jgi:hypothetical protein
MQIKGKNNQLNQGLVFLPRNEVGLVSWPRTLSRSVEDWLTVLVARRLSAVGESRS